VIVTLHTWITGKEEVEQCGVRGKLGRRDRVRRVGLLDGLLDSIWHIMTGIVVVDVLE
jgi:hypothetical protein